MGKNTEPLGGLTAQVGSEHTDQSCYRVFAIEKTQKQHTGQVGNQRVQLPDQFFRQIQEADQLQRGAKEQKTGAFEHVSGI